MKFEFIHNCALLLSLSLNNIHSILFPDLSSLSFSLSPLPDYPLCSVSQWLQVLVSLWYSEDSVTDLRGVKISHCVACFTTVLTTSSSVCVCLLVAPTHRATSLSTRLSELNNFNNLFLALIKMRHRSTPSSVIIIIINFFEQAKMAKNLI